MPEGSIVLKTSSDYIFNPDRPKCYSIAQVYLLSLLGVAVIK